MQNIQDEQKIKIFREFLETYSFFIDFNGAQYTMVDKENNIINISNTPDEILQYIMGFNTATVQAQQLIDECKEGNEQLRLLNETNIKQYEKIIEDLGGETLKDI